MCIYNTCCSCCVLSLLEYIYLSMSIYTARSVASNAHSAPPWTELRTANKSHQRKDFVAFLCRGAPAPGAQLDSLLGASGAAQQGWTTAGTVRNLLAVPSPDPPCGCAGELRPAPPCPTLPHPAPPSPTLLLPAPPCPSLPSPLPSPLPAPAPTGDTGDTGQRSPRRGG